MIIRRLQTDCGSANLFIAEQIQGDPNVLYRDFPSASRARHQVFRWQEDPITHWTCCHASCTTCEHKHSAAAASAAHENKRPTLRSTLSTQPTTTRGGLARTTRTSSNTQTRRDCTTTPGITPPSNRRPSAHKPALPPSPPTT